MAVPKARACAYELLRRQPEPTPLTRITLPWKIELATIQKGDTIQVGNDIFTVVGWQETSDHHDHLISYDMVPYVSAEC